MLINSLLSLLLALLRLLLTPLTLIALPATVITTVDMALAYIYDGLKIVSFYTHYSYIVVLVTLVVYIDMALFGYRAIMWILRKLPFFNVEE